MSDSKLMLFKGPLCQDPVEAYLSLIAQAILTCQHLLQNIQVQTY